MKWLHWAQRIQAIGQEGLAYARNPYDIERYRQIRALAAEIVAEHLSEPVERVAAAFTLESGHPTPKLDVRAVVFDGERLLLVRERAAGRWALPGGWTDVGESAAEAAARETLEESGFEVRPTKLLALLDKTRHAHPPSLSYTYKLFFLCERRGGEPRTSHEIDAVGFFGIDELPALDTARITLDQVRRMFEHRARPDLPADFD